MMIQHIVGSMVNHSIIPIEGEGEPSNMKNEYPVTCSEVGVAISDANAWNGIGSKPYWNIS